MTKRMPQAKSTPQIGKFNAYGLSVGEIQTLVHWVDTGTPENGSSDPLAQLQWDGAKWPSGEPEFGLYFHPEEFKPTKSRIQAAAWVNKFIIPPNADNHYDSNSLKVPIEVYLTSLSPHMHVRGKSMRFTVLYPDGREEQLLWVPQYTFNRQRKNTIDQPELIPAGTTILVEGTFNNSTKNAANSAPGEPVRWVDQRWEEMFIGFIAFRLISNN